jgi:transcriptional regulator of acetoin/glycerol metabolism
LFFLGAAALMISPFQTSKSNKPVAKAVYAFDEQSGAKWVPLNKSFITLAKIILQAAAERIGVSNIAVTLRCVTHQGYRHLLLKGNEPDSTTSALGLVEEFIISNESAITPTAERFSHMDTISVSMDYQGQRLGYLLATLPEADFIDQAVKYSPRVIEAELHVVASELGSIITRYQTRYRAIFIYGDQSYWVGNSAALRQIDKQIEQLRDVNKPILIRGNKGTGKSIAARSLHCSRHQSILPFIESSCNEWQEGAAASILQALYTYAKGGTLYLRNVDRLSLNNFRVLQRFWETIKQERVTKGAADSVGVIFSVSNNYFFKEFEMAGWLKENTIELQLPDLAQRREDLRDLVSFFIREYTLAADFDFTEHAWRLLESFTWRENVDQLKRVIQKVALVIEEPMVSVSLLEPLLKDW